MSTCNELRMIKGFNRVIDAAIHSPTVETQQIGQCDIASTRRYAARIQGGSIPYLISLRKHVFAA